uniref:Uncharacterized protein n=1 Tax=Arundo donax TaxID=35708 RepID=A0A0A9GU52_ARUDO
MSLSQKVLTEHLRYMTKDICNVINCSVMFLKDAKV